jgi:hypothetical protein
MTAVAHDESMITVLYGPDLAEVDLDGLAHDIALAGPRAHEAALAAVAAAAVHAGACPVLTDLLTDQTTPEIVRARAFGRLAAQLAPTLPADAETTPLLCA